MVKIRMIVLTPVNSKHYGMPVFTVFSRLQFRLC